MRSKQLNPVLRGTVWVLVFLAGGAAYAEPELKTTPQAQPAHPRQAYQIVCEVTWEGDPARYAILPAETETIDWGTVRVKKSIATVRDGMNLVSQTVEIVPEKVGEFSVPAITIAYLHPEDISPSETNASRTDPPERGASPTLASDPFTLRVQPDRTLAWVSGGLGVLSLCVALGWWFAKRNRKRRAERPSPSPAPDIASAESALKNARQRRINGEYYEFYVELNRAVQVLSPSQPENDLAARLKTRANDVGFRGVRPTEDDLEGDVRTVERALKKMKEELNL
ncbi:MAG: hypothetical protein HZB26_07945 [Candidatus Hydrogenedentes bacterium]|nr:hypothetical protein [Candidatus Hydrogenedentota bacterium]